jgi:cGMP-dependent protein kinase
MVFTKGFIKLIDFGTAKKVLNRTTTIIGTPHYMAPEVILGGGYTFFIDFWSIGKQTSKLAICMYEFVCGAVPFGDSAEDPMDVYMSIVNK